MNQIIRVTMMTMVITLFFVACNNNEKKEDPAKNTTETNVMTTDKTDNSKQNKDAVTVAPNLYKVVQIL